MALVFAVMHLYFILIFFITSVHSFFYTLKTSGIGKSTEWCPSLMCFFNRGDTKGTNSLKILCLMFVYVFVLCKFVYRTDFMVFE